MEINAIYEGDNIEVMSKFPDNSVDLIYADPPFFTNANYEVIWHDKEEIRSFKDRWEGGIEHYITWMEPRLRECYRVLKETGSMYLHCDYHADAHLRILMDKIFGENRFLNEIIWSYKGGGSGKDRFGRRHDTIFYYAKGRKHIFNDDGVRIPYLSAEGRDTKYAWGHHEGIDKEYKPNPKGKIPEDVWDIAPINSMSKERLGYPTQKPVELLERIVNASSNKESVVLDPFCGCGTTLVASQKLDRRWVGIDISPTACKLMHRRLKKEFSIDAQLIRGEVDLKYVKKLAPFEFQNWVIVDKFLGTISKTKSGDMGIDGLTPQITGGYPIQVKQSESIGRNPIDNFETAMRRANKNKGYFVAFSFGKGAYEGVAEAKNNRGIDITLRTVQDLLDGKIE